MRTTKIVFIGAGSISFGRGFLSDIFTAPELSGSTLSLCDIDAVALDRMYAVAQGLNRASGMNIRLEKSMHRRELLPGAEFVVSAICKERNALWKQDFLVPKRHGIRHTLGENGGPGALFFTLRTLPDVLDIARDMEELCPDALFMNFSNPESRIVLALGRYTKIRHVGLCHGVFMGQNDVARILGRKYEEIEVLGAGLNHFQWLLSVREKATGRDLYPELREKDAHFDPAFEPFARRLFRAFGYYPSCSDDHIGEYLPYGWQAGEHGYDFDADDAGRARAIANLESRVRGELGYEDMLKPSGERAVDIASAVMLNKRRLIESGIVYNRGAIPNLPEDAAVEVPIAVDVSGVHPMRIPLPAQLARVLTPQVMVQQMAVDAAVHASREMALQALLLDPVVSSMDAAQAILDELWALNAPYIRTCI